MAGLRAVRPATTRHPDGQRPLVHQRHGRHRHHLALGAQLAPLRERGVLIIGSGNVVHNLGAMNPAYSDKGFDWAQRFDDAARAQLLEEPAAANRLSEHRDFAASAPTPDHFIPMLYLAGLAAHGGTVDVLTDGCAYGSLSMTSYTLSS